MTPQHAESVALRAPYTVAEIEAKIASHDYNAELLLQHAMLHLREKPAASAEAHWYCVAVDGQATLCTGPEDARDTAAEADQCYPRIAPHRAVQLVPAESAEAKPVGYLPRYELERLESGHDARLRSAKFGPSQLDGDVPVYLAPTIAPALTTLVAKWRHAAEHLGLEDVLAAVNEALCSLLPGVHYMDPPDGGDVSPLEQCRRMAEDAAKFRALASSPTALDIEFRLRIARLLSELHGEEVLSEQQCAKYMRIDLVSWRKLEACFSVGGFAPEGQPQSLPAHDSETVLRAALAEKREGAEKP